METENIIEAHCVSEEVAAADLDHVAWESAQGVQITHYWSGEKAPVGRHAEARIIWTTAALYVRFVCRQVEPLVINETPILDQKTIGLWERDVCEIFIAPDLHTPEHYFEFEAAPTGEWLDLEVYQGPTERETNWQFQSGMTSAARIAEDSVTIAMRVPWEPLGRTPQEGERWRTNLFRCVGAGEERGYLAWRPTRTVQPNFHVPQAFGWLRFK